MFIYKDNILVGSTKIFCSAHVVGVKKGGENLYTSANRTHSSFVDGYNRPGNISAHRSRGMWMLMDASKKKGIDNGYAELEK